MQPNLTDINNALLEYMVQSTKQNDRIKALEAENTELREGLNKIRDALNEDIKKLEAELAALKDPWIRIDPEDEETLPSNDRSVDVSYVTHGDPAADTFVAYYYNDRWKVAETGELVSDEITIYSWRERPDPAPYPEGE